MADRYELFVVDLAKKIIAWRWAVIVLSILLVAATASGARNLTMSTDYRAWFSKENLKPLRVSYDTLSTDPVNVLARILDELGLDSDMSRGIRPSVAKLADATNRVWSERFRAERCDL